MKGTSCNRMQGSRPAVSRTLTVCSHIFISLDGFNCIAWASRENTLKPNLAPNS